MTQPRIRPLPIALVVTGLTALLSHVVPVEHGASAIGLTFLAATYWLCLREGQDSPSFGLALGGLFEPASLAPARLVREALQALGVALLVSALIFPPFYFGFLFWHAPAHPFSLARAWAGLSGGAPFGVVDLALGHLLAVALPEEAFFRGYLQSALTKRALTQHPTPPGNDHEHAHHSPPAHTPRASQWIHPAVAIVISSSLFAFGHFLTIPHPARLAVFFPSLAFGALRARTGGIGASVFFHAFCNLYSAALFAGFGLA